jgi:hypothetical protein
MLAKLHVATRAASVRASEHDAQRTPQARRARRARAQALRVRFEAHARAPPGRR